MFFDTALGASFKSPARIALASVLVFATTYTSANSNFENRIVGGSAVDISVAPATVALLNADRYNEFQDAAISQFCGGTLIHEKFVLTAAHCMERFTEDNSLVDLTAAEILVLAGSSDLSQPVSAPLTVSRIVKHPQYMGVIFGSDLAMLELTTPTSNPIAQLDLDPIVTGGLAGAFGWGGLRFREGDGNDTEPQIYPDELQAVALNLLTPSDCDITYPLNSQHFGVNISPDQVCAAVQGGGRDSCQGDSGGPLYRVTREGDTNFVGGLIGVVSYGLGCARADAPGVYAGVALQTEFIRGVINSAVGTVVPTTQNPTTPVTPTTNPQSPTTDPGTPADDPPTTQGPLVSALDNGGSGGGCSIGGTAGKDPLLPALAVASLLFLLRTRRHQHAVYK